MRLLGIGSGQVVKVDDADFEMLSRFTWRFDGRYASLLVGEDKVYMHKMLCDGDLVDHIDHDKLNNQRSNLRPASQQLNQYNRSTRNKGISWHKSAVKWEAYIHFNRSKIHLGLYSSRTDAEIARAAALAAVLQKLGEAPSV